MKINIESEIIDEVIKHLMPMKEIKEIQYLLQALTIRCHLEVVPGYDVKIGYADNVQGK